MGGAPRQDSSHEARGDADGSPSSTDPFHVFAEVCQIARQCLDFDRCVLCLIDADDVTFRCVASADRDAAGSADDPGTTYPVTDCPALLRIVRERRGHCTSGPGDETAAASAPCQTEEAPRVLGACFEPLIADDHVAGCLCGFHFDRPRQYGESERSTFAGLADLAGLLLQTTRLGHMDGGSLVRYCDHIEQSGDLIVTWDPDGMIVDASPAARDVLGLQPGSPWTDFARQVHPEDQQTTQQAWEEWKVASEPLTFDNRMLSKAGRHHRIYWHVRPSRDHAGHLIHVHGIGRDVTGWYRLGQDPQRLQRSESIVRLARGVAHKFNNLLVSVLGNASFLASQLEEDHPWRGILDDVIAGADQAAKLTRQLTTYARSTSHKPQRRRFQDLLAGHTELLLATLPSRVRLEMQQDASDDWVEVDAMQLGQVMLNLVLNAAEAMPDGGVISLQTANVRHDLGGDSGDRPCLALIVKDSGVGISPDHRTEIFDPFFSTKDLGRGLGLAAAQGIVQAHDGVIEVDSVFGAGTTVRVLLPLVEPEG